MEQPFEYIDDQADLPRVSALLDGAADICVDTEFMREKTYYPKLCLLQLATADAVFCIDPLKINDLSPVLEILYRPDVVKVLHAAKQDLEIFFHLRGAIPAPIYDTQIAAALLGQNDQVGYANLVQQELGVTLDKAHTRTDWSQRPLEQGQLRYAADDVIYLRQIYVRQQDALQRTGRAGWLSEDFQTLADPREYAPNPDLAWQRVKDARRLKPAQLGVLQKLAAWRELRAMELDRPRRWVIRDEVLIELARRCPATLSAMERIRGLEKAQIERIGDQLLQQIAAGREVPADQLPTLEPRIALSPEQEALVDAMMAVLRLRAASESLSPTMLASRSMLAQLVLGDRDVAVLHGWRGALVGKQLHALLDGSLWLGTENGILQTRTGSSVP